MIPEWHIKRQEITTVLAISHAISDNRESHSSQ